MTSPLDEHPRAGLLGGGKNHLYQRCRISDYHRAKPDKDGRLAGLEPFFKVVGRLVGGLALFAGALVNKKVTHDIDMVAYKWTSVGESKEGDDEDEGRWVERGQKGTQTKPLYRLRDSSVGSLLCSVTYSPQSRGFGTKLGLHILTNGTLKELSMWAPWLPTRSA
jgi:hypothetical protein